MGNILTNHKFVNFVNIFPHQNLHITLVINVYKLLVDKSCYLYLIHEHKDVASKYKSKARDGCIRTKGPSQLL